MIRKIKKQKFNKEDYYKKGNLKAKLGQNIEAIEYYDKAIEIDKNYKDAYINRGVLKVQLGEEKEAIKDYNKVIEIDANCKDVYNDRGLLKANLGEEEEAMKDYDKAIEIDADYKEAYNNRGLLKANLGKEEEAMKDYDKAIEIDANYKEAYSNRGNLKAELGQNIEAIRDYDKAIDIDKNCKGTYYNRGNLKAQLGEEKEAIKDYDKAIEIDANYKEAYNNRGVLKHHFNDHFGSILDFIEAKTRGDYKLEDLGRKLDENLNKVSCEYFNSKESTEKKIELIDICINKKLFFNINLLVCLNNVEVEIKEKIINKLMTSFNLNKKNHFLENSEELAKENRYYTYKDINKNTIEALVQKGVYKNDISNFNDPFDPYFKRFPTILNEELLRIKITCFSKTAENLLLWAHYSNNHKGICLGYELKKDENICFRKIIYNEIETQKTNETEESILKIDSIDIKESDLTIGNTYFRKHKDWSYENEYRILHLNTEKNEEKYFINLELKEIIFGMETRVDDIKLIKKIVNEIYIKDKEKVIFYKMKQGKNLTVEKEEI